MECGGHRGLRGSSGLGTKNVDLVKNFAVRVMLGCGVKEGSAGEARWVYL